MTDERPSLLPDAPRSNPLTRTTFTPYVAMLCDGDEGHYSPMPAVRAENASGPVECRQCGASMSVVDIIVVERKANWANLDYLGRRRRYYGV